MGIITKTKMYKPKVNTPANALLCTANARKDIPTAKAIFNADPDLRALSNHIKKHAKIKNTIAGAMMPKFHRASATGEMLVENFFLFS